MSILDYIEKMKDMYEGERIGTPTKEVTQHGRRIYDTPGGEQVSEKSTTFFLNGKWMNVPSIHGGRSFNDDQLRLMIKQGQIQPTSVHGSRIEAEAAAGQRSDMMKSHIKGFDQGGRIIGKPGGLVEPGVEYYGNKVKVDVAAETTSKFRNDISNWTENWINKNAYKYKLRDFEKFKKALSKAWLKESKNKKYKIPGVGTTKARILTKNGLPNIATTKSVQPFNMLGFEMPGGVSTEMTGSAQRNFFAKIFYKKHLNKNTDLAKSFNSYLDYMVADKRGTNQSAHSKIVRNLMKKSGVDDPLKLINDDVVYLLSNDSGLGGKARYELFTDTFGKKYTAYQDKMTTAQGSWNKAQKIIKAKTGIDIKKQLRVENEALRKLFKVTELPAELKYAGDHIFGVSQAAQTNNKKFMKAAIDNLVGMTATQNRFLGMGTFEKQRGKLVNKINKATGPNQAKLVKELNTLMGDTYTSSFPKGTKFYALDKGKLNINPNLKKLSQGERFMRWATEISKKPTKILKETFTDPKVLENVLALKKGDTTGMNLLLKTAKTAKGPAKFKAIQAIIATVGMGAAASLFDKFGIQPAMADTGAAAAGVTPGDIALAGAAPLATKKGRGLYKKALSGASKILSKTPGFLGLEAFVGPGFVSSAGGSFSEAIASPLLLEGTMRNRRIYNKLKDIGLDTKNIEIVKESLMLDADPFMSSMMPVSKEAINPEVRTLASQAYDWASEEIAKEDKARLERADKFDYLQDVGFAGGGLANLTRTVAPDSGPMSQGLRSLYINDRDY